MIRFFSICTAVTATVLGHGHASDQAHKAPLTHTAVNSWEQCSFKIEDSKCRIGIASVKLSVSELTPKDGKLIATYAINVPLSQSNNDTGQIVLPINTSISEIERNGGVFKGHAYSDNKDKKEPSTIICKIGPLSTKDITLEITTSTRTLNFESRYTVITLGTDS